MPWQWLLWYRQSAIAVAVVVPVVVAWRWPSWCPGSGHHGAVAVAASRWHCPLHPVPAERHRHLLPGAGGRGRGELRPGPRPLPPLGRALPRLHPRPPQETPLLPRQAPRGAAGRGRPGRAAGPGGGGGGGGAAAGQHRPHPAHPPRPHPQRLPQRLGAARWARGAGRRAAGRGAAGAGGGDGAAPGRGDLLLEDARPLGVHLPAHAEPGAAAPPPHRHLPAAPLHRAPPAAGGQDASQRERGERLRLAGAPRPGGHRSHGGWSGEFGKRPQRAAGHRQRHGAERRLLQHHQAPHRHLPEHGAGRRGGRGTGQHRHQVRPPALAGVPRGAGTSPSLGQRHPRKGIKLLPTGTRVRVGVGGGSGVAGRERGAGRVGTEPARHGKGEEPTAGWPGGDTA